MKSSKENLDLKVLLLTTLPPQSVPDLIQATHIVYMGIFFNFIHVTFNLLLFTDPVPGDKKEALATEGQAIDRVRELNPNNTVTLVRY